MTALAALIGCQVLIGQNQCSTYFPFTEQKKLEYVNYDKKGEPAGKTLLHITVVDDIDNGLEAQVESTILDDQDEVLSEGAYQVQCVGNELRMDISNVMSPELTASFSHLEVTLSGDPFTLPAEWESGQALPDATNRLQAGSEGLKLMDITIQATNRKIEAEETLKTQAGSFETIRLEYDLSMKMIINKSFRIIQWYAPNVGIVRSESYNKKGKMIDSMELVRVEDTGN